MSRRVHLDLPPYPRREFDLVSVGGGRAAVLHLEPWARAVLLVNRNEDVVVRYPQKEVLPGFKIKGGNYE